VNCPVGAFGTWKAQGADSSRKWEKPIFKGLCFSALDDKIGQVGQQLEKAKEWKKGLLQGMFV
jgi:hypothetical protein